MFTAAGRLSILKCWLLTLLLLSACTPAILKQEPAQNTNEQLYVDARLGFAIEHPQRWDRRIIPVSSPEYRADTVSWQITTTAETGNNSRMLIRSQPADQSETASDLLQSFLPEIPELETREQTPFSHPGGEALKLIGSSESRTMLVIAIKGEKHDFILSFACPEERFEELLPTFEDVVDSFVELATHKKTSD